jgi:hypothetical protein
MGSSRPGQNPWRDWRFGPRKGTAGGSIGGENKLFWPPVTKVQCRAFQGCDWALRENLLYRFRISSLSQITAPESLFAGAKAGFSGPRAASWWPVPARALHLARGTKVTLESVSPRTEVRRKRAGAAAAAEQNGSFPGGSGVGGRHGRRWLARALGMVLLLQVLLTPAPANALNWRLPGRAIPSSPRPAGDNGPSHLREVPPPAWVQKARLALEDRNPSVTILAPADGEILPDGPWSLRLRVEDWPLVDGGSLGLGPHLVVQLDGEPPRPAVDTTVAMPPLSPGSHLLTVYAAKPWGEAHKSPLAIRQIRLHRLAPNPATLPAPHTPQLIPVSPTGPASPPPLLLDWLLIEAPLQGLRADTSGWRLRLTVNGESVLLDQQTPLWLQGWKPGGNALLLELLDGRGEPLNPPFNSLLREVIVPPAGSGGAGRSPADPLTDLELAVLLGERPVSDLTPVVPAPPDPQPLPAEPTLPSAPEESSPEPPLSFGRPSSMEDLAEREPPAAPEAPAAPASPGAGVSADVVESPSSTGDAAEPTEPPSAELAPAAPASPEAPGLSPVPSGSDTSTAATPQANQADSLLNTAPLDRLDSATPAPPSPPDQASPSAREPSPDPAPSPPASTAANTPARAELNADGTRRRPSQPGPLERLRERLGR